MKFDRTGGVLIALALLGAMAAPPAAYPQFHSWAAPLATPAARQDDGDLGCCVLKTEPVTCFWTNRAYCRSKAEEARVSFDFHKDEQCRDREGCRKAAEGAARECR